MTITIRHAEPGDYEALYKILSSPRVVAGTLQMPIQSVEQVRRRVAEPAAGRYSLVACVEGEVVGNLGLHVLDRPRRRHVGDIGMAVRDDWQGKGVGTALMAAMIDLADNWLNLMRIELTVYTDNAAAVALYQKFGFAIEGTLRRYAFRNGEYVDAYSLARVREAV
ncbi:MAG: GNAT family N-acetyltransferase [Roseiflexaceae bacterium]